MTKNMEKILEVEKMIKESERLAMERRTEALKKLEAEIEKDRMERIKKATEEAELILKHSRLKAKETAEIAKKESERIYVVTSKNDESKQKTAVGRIREMILS